MKGLMLAALLTTAVTAPFTPPTSAPIFANSAGNTGEDFGYRCATDQNGDIVTTGRFEGSVDFDPGAGSTILTSQGSSDIFVAKYSGSGELIWAIPIGGTDRDGGYSVTTDASNNIYVTGFFRGTADFDASAATVNLVSNGDMGTDPGYGGEVFVAKYSPTGDYIWAFGIGGSTMYDNGQDIHVDINNNLLVAGYFVGPNVDFDPSPSSTLFRGDGSENMFLAKYTLDGALIWANDMGSPNPGNESVRKITTDENGNIYATGFFSQSCDFDPGPGTASLAATSLHEGFIAKYNSAGQYQWVYQFGGTAYNQGLGIDYSNGLVYFTGHTQGAGVDFLDANGGVVLNPAGGTDAFIASYTVNGEINFIRRIAGSNNDEGYDLKVDATGGVLYLTGVFEGTCDFDPSAGQTANLTSNGATDVFVAKYLLNGNYISAFQIGGTNQDYGWGLSVTNGELVVSGAFNGTDIDFDPTAGNLLRSAQGITNAFVAKYNTNITVPTTIKSFSAVMKSPGLVSLNWNTLNESDLANILVTRSTDGVNFETLATIAAKGGTTINQYYYNDATVSLTATKVFYQLSFVDNDGSVQKSRVVPITVGETAVPARLLPNPSKGSAILEFVAKNADRTALKITDQNGRIVKSQQVQITKGSNKLAIPGLDVLPNGYYIVTLSVDDVLVSQSLVIQK